MRYSQRKANVRPPRSLLEGSDNDRQIFKELINKLTIAKYTIVYIDECSFNSGTLPAYTWMKIGEEPSKLIRNTNNRYNSIAAQWNNQVYFLIKNTTADGD